MDVLKSDQPSLKRNEFPSMRQLILQEKVRMIVGICYVGSTLTNDCCTFRSTGVACVQTPCVSIQSQWLEFKRYAESAVSKGEEDNKLAISTTGTLRVNYKRKRG